MFEEENKFLIKNKIPATKWQDATPLGNGRVGAMLYGSIYDERILLNHENLYDGEIELPIPDISDCLPKVRKLLDEGRYCEADGYYVSKLKECGYFTRTGDFLPAFDLHMITHTDKAFTDYSRCLNMRSGIASVSWKDGDVVFTRELFVSMDSNEIVMKLTASKPVLNFDLRLEAHDLADAVDMHGNTLNDSIPNFSFTTVDKLIEGVLTTSSGKKLAARLLVHSDGQTQLYNCKNVKKLNDMQGTLAFSHNYFSVRKASIAVAVCKLFYSNEKQIVDDFELEDYQTKKNRHIEKFTELFDSMQLDLGVEKETRPIEMQKIDSYNGDVRLSQIEQMALFGRYLLISSSSNCNYPANLQGIWNGAYMPAWSCTFFNNENVEMNYWQALSGNLAQTELPLFDFYLSMMDDYRENAKKFFGCRGILLPMFCDNVSGKKKNLQAHVVYWTASSSWIANMFFDYYLFTRDKRFLLEKAYPFMKEAALFYEDFMQLNERGELKSYPSNSPENCAKGDFEGSENIRVCINATMDFAALKQLLSDLLKAEKILNITNEKHSVWSSMLVAIPAYKINQDGALCEWMHEDFRDNYAHRHLSHLYPLFPGREVSDRDTEIFQACKKAVDLRYSIGLKEQTGWSLAHMANLWAKLGEGDYALECLKLLIRFCTGKNLFTYHNDWHNQGVTLKYLWAGQAPFQIDANLGFTAAVQQMLIDSNEQEIILFPAVPKEWNNLSIGPCLTRCGVSVIAKKSGNKICVTLCAKENVRITLRIGLGTQKRELDLKANKEICLEETIE